MARHRKYSTETLMQCIETYKIKYKNQFTTLSASKIAKYMTDDLKMPAYYQDFTRNKDIKAHIDEYNKGALERAKILVHRHAVDSDMPFYTPIDVKQFMKKNNTPKKLEEALITLDSIREKDHSSYQKLVSKLVEVAEKYAILNQENIDMKRKIEQMKNDFEEKLKTVKKEFIKIAKKSKEHHTRAKIYEHFLREHHFQTIEEMGLYLENIIASGVDLDNAAALMNVESYKNNKYDMMNVLKAYNSIISSVTHDDENEMESNFEGENDTPLYKDDSEEGIWADILQAINSSKHESETSKDNELLEVQDGKTKGKKLRERMRSMSSKIPED
ncbi:hypothetical protein SAMN05444673_4429 [Bacillus sp. OV166]|uniref:hypothetical protein n=1 Tax=Bacillus sp. OV166 TaxID=1882763 RepID=UPI000A2AC226|nr:hypothetical protein [Bacillus sp. OV166]SMQ81649.1 hypothetical protein SAMN05444673_4429 [Bacillus sp. OV166]